MHMEAPAAGSSLWPRYEQRRSRERATVGYRPQRCLLELGNAARNDQRRRHALVA
jgi:hypothetical protein